jgi:hypothetical protein
VALIGFQLCPARGTWTCQHTMLGAFARHSMAVPGLCAYVYYTTGCYRESSFSSQRAVRADHQLEPGNWGHTQPESSKVRFTAQGMVCSGKLQWYRNRRGIGQTWPGPSGLDLAKTPCRTHPDDRSDRKAADVEGDTPSSRDGDTRDTAVTTLAIGQLCPLYGQNPSGTHSHNGLNRRGTA